MKKKLETVRSRRESRRDTALDTDRIKRKEFKAAAQSWRRLSKSANMSIVLEDNDNNRNSEKQRTQTTNVANSEPVDNLSEYNSSSLKKSSLLKFDKVQNQTGQTHSTASCTNKNNHPYPEIRVQESEDQDANYQSSTPGSQSVLQEDTSGLSISGTSQVSRESRESQHNDDNLPLDQELIINQGINLPLPRSRSNGSSVRIVAHSSQNSSGNTSSDQTVRRNGQQTTSRNFGPVSNVGNISTFLPQQLIKTQKNVTRTCLTTTFPTSSGNFSIRQPITYSTEEENGNADSGTDTTGTGWGFSVDK